MNKHTLFGILTVCCFLECLSRSLITPFFPPYAKEKGISTTIIGIIISCNPVGSLFASIILGKILNKNNRYFYMIMGLLVQSIGTYGFVATYYTDDATFIIIIAVASRIISGVGVQLFMTPYYAFIPILYPNDVEQMIAVAEIFSGGGFMVGPALGSVVYSLGGYTSPFLVFGTSTLIAAPITYLLIIKQKPTKIDLLLKKSQMAYQAESELVPVGRQIGYAQILAIYATLITVSIEVTANIAFTFYSPIMADYLQDVYNYNPDNVGYVISLTSVSYCVCCFGVAKIKSGKKQVFFYFKKQFILGGTIVMGLSCIFMGPDLQFTGLDHHNSIMLISWTLFGAASSFLWVLCLPLVNEILVGKYPEQPEKCANLSSGLLNAAISLGDFLGPIMGGVFVGIWSFEKSSSILGFIVLFNALLFVPLLFQYTPKPVMKESPGTMTDDGIDGTTDQGTLQI